MNKQMQPWQLAAIAVVLIGLIVFFGVRWMNGGPNADVTQQNLKYYGGAKSNASYPGAAPTKPSGR